MKENKDKEGIGIGALIALILAGAVVLVAIVRALNCCIPPTSKFDVSIWGNVSEWFTFLVALIGSVFIYKTLDSQMKVQKDQNRIFKIEELKYLRSIKPTIEVEPNIIKFHQSTEDENKKALEINFLIESDNDGMFEYKISTISKTPNDSKTLSSYPKSSLLKGKTLSLNIIHHFDKKDKSFAPLRIEISYSDMDGNQYKLTKEWTIFGNDMIISLPDFFSDELIKTVY